MKATTLQLMVLLLILMAPLSNSRGSVSQRHYKLKTAYRRKVWIKKYKLHLITSLSHKYLFLQYFK